MTVYVDALRKVRRCRQWPFTQAAHLVADDVAELHAFAASIGMRREWFQPGSSPHYDLNANRHARALERGAVLVDRRELVRVIRRLRERVVATVAALFVQADGIYPRISGVDCWDAERDATTYAGPWPVVAHPPCARWSRFWASDGSTVPGNDGGLFASALASVRRWGGVLEHPEASHAWRHFDLPPAVHGAWSRGICGGWSTCVAQSAYGHRARKLTWLYYFGTAGPAPLDWKIPPSVAWLSQPGRCSNDQPRRRCACSRCAEFFGDDWLGGDRKDYERMSPRENAATPERFAVMLVDLARRSAA